MRKLSKILALVLVLMTVFSVITAITASAAAGQVWTVAGSSGLCGSNWSTTDTKNDMTYDEATDSYVKVYYNVKAGTYEFKCAKNHAWSTAYPGSNKKFTVAKDGSTVTITLKGTAVSVKVEAPACDHAYEVTGGTVTCLTAGTRTWTCSKCNDSYTEDLEALGHYYDATGKCIRCDATAELVRVYVDNAAKWANVYCYTWDTNPYVAWPGEKMQLDSESGLYYYDIPKHFVNVIFNNGDGTQSADLKTPTGTATVYNNSTKKWTAPHVCSFVDGKCTCGEFDSSWTVAGTLEELNAALVNGGNIILNGDITSSEIIVVGVPAVINGNGHTITSTAGRAINISGADGVTIKNLKVVANGERAFNVIQNATNVVLDNITATAWNYTVNVAGSAANAVITVKNSDLTGLNTVNIAGAGAQIAISDTKITCDDQNDLENYGAITVGPNCPGVTLVGTGVEFDVKGDSCKVANSSQANITFTDAEVEVTNTVAMIVYGDYAYTYTTLEDAIAAAQAGETVYVFAGTYALPSMKAGITIEGVGEVLFEGTLSGTLENLTLKNIHIKGANAQRWAYAKGDLVFENVIFEATGIYALHFDGITEGATLLYKDCTIIGWAAMSGSPASCVFDGCTIKGNGSYGVIRTYFDATIENCTFDVSNVNPDDVYQDGIHSVGATVTVNNCTNANGEMNDIINISTAGYIVLDGETIHVHSYAEGETVAATCTTAGHTTYTCPCGHTYTEEVEALGHDIVVDSAAVDATCTATGLTAAEHCTRCDYVTTQEEVAALGHNFVEGVCSRCDEEDPNYESPHTHKDTGLDAKCDECGEYFLPTSPFKLEMYQASKKQTYYFTGAMSGYYFATSTDITKAVDLYAEEVEGGYNVYFMSGSTKNYLYIQLSGTHINAKFGSTKAVWYVDPTYGCLTTEVSGTKYFLGTYSSYVTFGGTAYSRLTASTADVSQYVGRAVSLVDHVCAEFTSKVTAPTCTAQGYTTKTCAACGVATKVDYVDALGHDLVDVEALAPTCTAAGYTAHKDCSRCTYVEGKEAVAALGHKFFAGACTVCEAADPDYNAYLLNFSQWPEFAKETYADGDIFKYNDIFTFIMGKNSRVDGSEKTWDDFTGTLRFSFGGKTPTGAVPTKNALQITVDGAYTIKIWYVAGGDGRYFALMDAEGTVLSETTKETVKNGQDYAELVIPAAGTYYFGVPGDNNYIFQIELVKHEHQYGEGVVTAPTCTEAGYTTYTCSCGHSYTDSEVAALGHTEEVVAGKDATCTEAGLTEGKKCSVCGETLVAQEEIAALGHTEVVDEAVAPTCTSTGKTEGKHCSVCEEVLVAQEDVAALEHNYVNGSCEVCGKEDPNYVAPHEHVFVEGKCECGETDPNYQKPVDPQPPVDGGEQPTEEPEGLAKVWNMILTLVAWLVEFFKGLFVKA